MWQGQLRPPWPYTALLGVLLLQIGQSGSQTAPAPAPALALVSSRADWVGLREPGSMRNITQNDLSVPSTGIQLGIEMAGRQALATDDVMETLRSVLSQVLPTTYSDVDPQAYMNVTVCPAPAPAPAPGAPGKMTNVGGRRLKASIVSERMLLQDSSGGTCVNKMRAVFMLRRSLGTGSSFGNASAIQKTVRDAFYSGFLLSRSKRSRLDVDSLDLLAYQEGGTSGVIYPSSDGGQNMSGVGPTAGPATAPAPAIVADASWSLNHPGPATNATTNVFFTLVLTGQDAVETNSNMVKRLSYVLTDVLNTGDVDYLTDNNTAVVKEEQLPPVTPSGRRLLSSEVPAAYGGMEVDMEMVPLSDSEHRAMAAWLRKGGRQGRRGIRSAHASRVLSRRQILQSSPNEAYTGPVNALAVTYRVSDLPSPGPAVVAEKLSYFIQTGQMVSYLQQAGYKIGTVQLKRFSPLPGVPAHAPGALPVPPGEEGAVSTAQAGPNLKFVGKLVLGIVLPISLLAIGAAAIFAFLFFKYKRRYAESERPIKDSAESMMGSGRKSLPISSGGSGGLRDSGSQYRSGSGGIRGIMENLSQHQDVSGQEALALASLAKRSLTLPGMQSDWEIDPDELEIARKPDGTEWRLGTGASAHVYKAIRNGVQVVAVKIFTDQVAGENQARYTEAFRREIFILRSCHDRNIVQFLGACLQVGQTILVQEYMENGDLYHAISEDMSGRFGWYRKKLPSGRPVPNTGMARRIALDTARGLFFLHSRKIVHFDLKSANVLLGRDWTAKIADVGLAKILKDGWLSTLREVGTFSWAAPEVLLGKPCTEKVDIYSYGVLLWELSAGEAPPGRNLRPLRSPEECPADVEAIIARCLDNDPDKRPSARELVEFMVHLPQQLSLDSASTGTEGSNDRSSSMGSHRGSAGSNGGSEMLSSGKSIPPMTPRPPPGGMVLPNAFGLMSMKSFKRSSSSKGAGAQDSANGKPATPAGSGNGGPEIKAQTSGKSLPGSAFRSLKSMSFKRRPSQGGLETTVEESSASMSKEFERAVARSNSSFREATENRGETVSPDAASSAAASVRGEARAEQSGLESRKSVHFEDSHSAGASPGSTAAQANGESIAGRRDNSRSKPEAGRSWLRSAFESRDSANEAAAHSSTADRGTGEQSQAARAPVSSAFAGNGGDHSSGPAPAAAPQNKTRMPFKSAFATEASEQAPSNLPGAPQPQSTLRSPVPHASAAEEPGQDTSAPACAPDQPRARRRPVPSAFAAEEPDQDESGSGVAPEPPRQQRGPPIPSAFAQSDSPADTSSHSPSRTPLGNPPSESGTGGADGEHVHATCPGLEQKAEPSQPAKAKGVIPLIKSAFQSED
ncbi:hypothetical protein CVIRNUC_008276 [Coccomyxa viridis]|uniref:Protein kinase domain-containing protein n=1 Tax=Coccomyxa viridis TaxID=1274662 RepID=A0AAV1IFP9_9CHLO|nr:hypothetical protein CVIRNUC_008276 [Coccomyxa viridis]